LNFGIVAVVALFTLIIGFLIGVRAKQILQSAKKSAQAIFSLKELFRAGAEQDKDDGEAETADGDEDQDEEPQELLESFMNNEQVNGLDDHPDIVRSPIIMYQVKVAKDEARREKRKLALIAEGMDEDDAEQMLQNEAAGGLMSGGGNEGRQNALATLIAAGARVTAVGGGQSAEAVLADERKRMARTIDVFLEKNRGIDTTKTVKKSSSGGQGKRLDNALEVAFKSANTPFGGDAAKRETERISMAKSGRTLLRGLHARREKLGLNRVKANEEEAVRKVGGTAGALLSSADQMALLAELAEEEGMEPLEGEGEDDEGEEGADVEGGEGLAP
jgi:hypothetical protein